MAIDDGFSRYQCDVGGCPKKGYLKPGSQGAAAYTEREYLDANGQTRNVVMCSDHAAQLDRLKRYHDVQFDAFMKDGTLPEGVE